MGAFTGRLEPGACGACMEVARELLGGDGWFGAVVLRSAMTRWSEDNASLDSEADTGAGDEDWPIEDRSLAALLRFAWEEEGWRLR